MQTLKQENTAKQEQKPLENYQNGAIKSSTSLEHVPQVGNNEMRTFESNKQEVMKNFGSQSMLTTADELTLHEYYGTELAARNMQEKKRFDQLNQLNDRLFSLANQRFKTRLAQLESRHPMFTGLQPCTKAEAAVVSCFASDHGRRPLECAQLVKQFTECVRNVNKETLLQ